MVYLCFISYFLNISGLMLIPFAFKLKIEGKEGNMTNLDLSGEISRVAYELYERSGRMEGCDLDNWLKAEKIVMTQYAEKKYWQRNRAT